MRIINALSISILFLSCSAVAQEQYLCVSHAAGGVRYDSAAKNWVSTKFKNDDSKYLVIQKNNKWIMKIFGKNYENECGSMSEYGILRCEPFFGEFVFNKKTKRYLKTYIAGFIDGSDGNDNTPLVEVGYCSPL